MYYNPTEIVRLLMQRDEKNSDQIVAPFNGVSLVTFIYGSTTSIPPGQSARVTMDFVQKDRATGSGAAPKFFQLDSEIVVGLATGTKQTYSLQNLMFDRVSMPVF